MHYLTFYFGVKVTIFLFFFYLAIFYAHYMVQFIWMAVSDIRISNQFLITRALHFAQPQAYYQASVTIILGRRV